LENNQHVFVISIIKLNALYWDSNKLRYIKKSEYELNEGWYTFGRSPREGTFYSLDRTEIDIIPSFGDGVFIIDFHLDPLINQFQRDSLTFFEAFGTIGGIFEILNIIIGLFTGFYAQYAFRHSLLKSLKRIKSQSPIIINDKSKEPKERDRSQLYIHNNSSSAKDWEEINPRNQDRGD